MRFSRHLSSHLTPEWRKQYIQYAELKKLVYEMVGSKKTLLGSRPHNREELFSEDGGVEVDESLQEDFFKRVDSQLQSINEFFQFEESRLQYSLSEMNKKIIQIFVTKVRRSTKQRQVLKRALSEIYLNVVLLQNFQQLNHTGFRKILKKHDKLTRSTHGNKVFKDDVCASYFWTSKLVTKMLSDSEKMMIQLEGGNRTKAMNRLRVPPLGEEHTRSHWTSFFAGLFCGLLILSIIVVCFALNSWDIEETYNPHFEPTMRGMRAGLLLCLWFFGFAINTYGWRTAGVNNVLIFEFDPRDYLNFVELFAVAGVISFIWISGMYLIAFSPWLHIPLYVGPLLVYGVLLFVLFLPLPVLRLSSRLWLMKKLGRIICAPFFEVKFADFWLADQLTSLGIILLDTEYFFCYLIYGQNSSEGAIFSCGNGTYGLRVVIAALPSWWRFAQCLRRYYDTKQANPHLINAGKYSTSFFVVVFSAMAGGVLQDDEKLTFVDQSLLYFVFFTLWILSGIVSTSYKLSWDILMDWSLFPNIPQYCCHKKALRLRKDKIYSYRFYYVLALVEDFLLRIVWVLTVLLGHHVARVDGNNIISTIAGIMEVIRRFVWNFFRVENEHVNNVGQFRAVRDISLYPVDLSNQRDDDDNEDSTVDRRGSLDRWTSSERHADRGKKKKSVQRNISNTLMDINEPGGNGTTVLDRLRRGKPKETSESENLLTSKGSPIKHSISNTLLEISEGSEDNATTLSRLRKAVKPRSRNLSSISATIPSELLEAGLEKDEMYCGEASDTDHQRSLKHHGYHDKKTEQQTLSNSQMKTSGEFEGGIALATRLKKAVKPRSRNPSSISATIQLEAEYEQYCMAELHTSLTEQENIHQFSSSPTWSNFPSLANRNSPIQINMEEHDISDIQTQDITTTHRVSTPNLDDPTHVSIQPLTKHVPQTTANQEVALPLETSYDTGSPPYSDLIAPHDTGSPPYSDLIAPHDTGSPPYSDLIAPHDTGSPPYSDLIAPHDTGSPPYSDQEHTPPSNIIVPPRDDTSSPSQ